MVLYVDNGGRANSIYFFEVKFGAVRLTCRNCVLIPRTSTRKIKCFCQAVKDAYDLEEQGGLRCQGHHSLKQMLASFFRITLLSGMISGNQRITC